MRKGVRRERLLLAGKVLFATSIACVTIVAIERLGTNNSPELLLLYGPLAGVIPVLLAFVFFKNRSGGSKRRRK